MFEPTEDFWSRRANTQAYTFACAPLGMPTTITANDEAVLSAARLSAGRFSHSPPSGPTHGSAPTIQIVVRPQPTALPPADLPERLVYSGVGEWITISAGEWGHGFANLATREANIFLSPALAADVRLVSRYFIDHYALNFLLADWAMLHASCVLKEGRLLVLVAPHNVGKSTAALHLLRAGYTFLADGMVLIREREKDKDRDKEKDREWMVGGYPIGEVKLRDDVLALFPEYTGQAVRVREHRKTVVDLRQTHPGQLAESSFTPSIIHVCLAERITHHASRITSLTPAEAAPTLAANTVYWDQAARLTHNTAILNHLMQTAHFHRLSIGTDTDSLVALLETLR